MGHSTSSGRSGGTSGGLEARARNSSVDTVLSTFETNITGNISAQIVSHSAERELERRLSETSYASQQDAPPLRDPANATAKEREDWIRSASNRQLMSAFSSSASRLRRDGIPSSLDGSQYRLAKAEIKRRLGG